MDAIRALLASIRDILSSRRFQGRLPIYEILTLSAVPVDLHRHGRRYTQIYLPIGQSLIVDYIGVTQFELSLPAGWSELPFPDRTPISLSSPDAFSINIIHRASDDLISSDNTQMIDISR